MHRIAGDVLGIFITTRLGVRSLLVERYVSIKLKYLPLYVLIIVDDTSSTSYNNFMAAYPRCAFKLIFI